MNTKITGLVLILASACGAVFAQSYPVKPVRIIIGVAAGGLSDNLARAIGGELSKVWGQSVLIENRVGASDIVAAEAVARSPADGYAIYQTNGTLTMVNALLRKNLPYDFDRDFAPVIGVVRTSDVLMVRNSLRVNSVAELVALARSKPGVLNYGSFGIGSAAHLDAEKFNVAASLRTTHVPYKGGADVAKALLTGEIDFSFNGLSSVLGLIRQGQARALAWGAPERSPAIPDVPTLKEAGFDFDTGGWLGFFVPSATPRAVTEKISSDTSRVLANPAFRDKFILGVGLEPLNLPLAQFGAMVRDTRSTYVSLFSKIEIKLQ
ncbi:MAG: tripartite tricarboxylate transporter substrate binding protein [Betaproteobacteria bacterium]|nr:tripartite tricarboxylate transporter substrate binding protein [Betaproteobacteria bacterium]